MRRILRANLRARQGGNAMFKNFWRADMATGCRPIVQHFSDMPFSGRERSMTLGMGKEGLDGLGNDRARLKRLRVSIGQKGFDVIRPLGYGSFGRVILVKDVQRSDGQLFAVKLQRLAEEEMTPEQVMEANDALEDFVRFTEGCESSLVKRYLLQTVNDIRSKIEQSEVAFGDVRQSPFRVFEGRKIRRATAEVMILDHLANPPSREPPADSVCPKTGSSPFVIRKHDSFADEDCAYLVLDYVSGGTLESLAQRQPEGRLSEDTVRFYAAELVLAIRYLRGCGVTHRDFKASNVMLCEEGHVVLTDFGLATRVEYGLRTFCGTAGSIPPETLVNSSWDAHRLDIWALGVLMYELLSGKGPFDGKDANEVFLKIMTLSPTFDQDQFSPQCRDLLSQLLEKEPGARPSTTDIMKHPFFATVDWEALVRKEVDVPLVPNVPAKEIIKL